MDEIRGDTFAEGSSTLPTDKTLPSLEHQPPRPTSPTLCSTEHNFLESPTDPSPGGIAAQLRRFCSYSRTMQASHLIERYTALVKEDPHMYRAAESLLSTLSYLATNRFGFLSDIS